MDSLVHLVKSLALSSCWAAYDTILVIHRIEIFCVVSNVIRYPNFCKLTEVIAMISTFETHPLTEKRRGVHVGPGHHVCNVTCDATHVLHTAHFVSCRMGIPSDLASSSSSVNVLAIFQNRLWFIEIPLNLTKVQRIQEKLRKELLLLFLNCEIVLICRMCNVDPV